MSFLIMSFGWIRKLSHANAIKPDLVHVDSIWIKEGLKYIKQVISIFVK